MTRQNPRTTRVSAPLGVASVALATSLIGTIGTASELGPDTLSALATGSWRATIGATAMLAGAVIGGQAPWRYAMPARWVLFGASGVAASQLAFFEAVSRTGVAVGTLVAIGVGPLVAGVIDWLAHRHRPSRRWLAGVGLATAGVVLLSGGAAEVAWSGVAFAVVAGCGIPIQGFAVQHLMRDRPMLPAMSAVVGAGALFLLPTALGSADLAFSSIASTSTVMYLGLVTVALAHSLWGIGLGHLSLSVAVVVGLLEPAVAATLAMTVLSEPVTPALLIGVCMVIAGVAVTSVSQTGPLRGQAEQARRSPAALTVGSRPTTPSSPSRWSRRSSAEPALPVGAPAPSIVALGIAAAGERR